MSESSSYEQHELPGVPPEKIPRHVAIIMDGNGRWAQQQGLPRIEGHRHGAMRVRRTVAECARLGGRYLPLYCLTSENWKRPDAELEFLMHMLQQYMIEERSRIMKHEVRVTVLGRRDNLPDYALAEIDKTEQLSSGNARLHACLAINYGGRAELVDAMRAIAAEVKAGELQPENIDEDTIESHLYTAGIPDPDLMIRTAGEMRISNFLLWQLSYSELWVTEKFWPEFDEELFHEAIRDYASRDRRFGGLNE
jgi:undecaprenyl diphosphate synthase